MVWDKQLGREVKTHDAVFYEHEFTGLDQQANALAQTGSRGHVINKADPSTHVIKQGCVPYGNVDCRLQSTTRPTSYKAHQPFLHNLQHPKLMSGIPT